MFIEKSDVLNVILEDELEEITRGDDTLVLQAITAAVGSMRVYLYDSYDTEAIFSATGANRYGLLVQYCADIAVYFLVSRLQAGQDIEDRRARYDRAIAWLKAAQKSEFYADLPRRDNTRQKHIGFGYSAERRGNYY